ncbi:MAG: hypothetical protein RLZZ436_1060, partial [Planctomycetota bacterium]
GGSPRLRFRTLVRTPARGVSSALPGHFTRGLPPCGSCDFGIAIAEIMSGRAEAQWPWLSGTTRCRAGEAPAEPHPCRERFFDPRCAAKTLANAHSADQRSAARQEPRPPRFSPVFSQNFREPHRHQAAARLLRELWGLLREFRRCGRRSGRTWEPARGRGRCWSSVQSRGWQPSG